MAAPQSPRDILAEVMDQSRKALVPHLAEMLKRSKIKEVDSSEERTRFWQRALTPEQEQELWRQELVKAGTLDTSALSPQQLLGIGITISQQVYPDGRGPRHPERAGRVGVEAGDEGATGRGRRWRTGKSRRSTGATARRSAQHPSASRKRAWCGGSRSRAIRRRGSSRPGAAGRRPSSDR
jgi:hypothetical protein